MESVSAEGEQIREISSKPAADKRMEENREPHGLPGTCWTVGGSTGRRMSHSKHKVQILAAVANSKVCSGNKKAISVTLSLFCCQLYSLTMLSNKKKHHINPLFSPILQCSMA